ncbi:hypothetical protein Cgig2_033378 [Carnegiea gigantea]|uniref:F-box domain-containing protein n=1 Tax=Carnegiea gigantea TaxID=171969 RepID=A0A9Q1KUY9_9CARY|nr:hypothetical protein Cgig2_033378 [Carnegiea gigantea]
MERDFLEVLDSDVAVKILKCLEDPADVVRACSVSRSWRDFGSGFLLHLPCTNAAFSDISRDWGNDNVWLMIANGICKHLCVKLFPQVSGISRIINVSSARERFVDVGCSSTGEWEHLKLEHRAYTSLAWWLTSSEVGECTSDAISASSTDNYPEESVRNTLISSDRIGRRASYWSSSGQSNPEVPERLTYKLISDLCVVTEINVQPFQAFFQPHSPIYSAKAVRFRMGRRISPHDGEGDVTDGEGPPPTEGQFVWTYTSPEFPMLQETRLQNFKLPKPVICVGGILQIELLGRVQRQEMDDLFYICVAYVQIIGRLLDPVFGIESIEPSGRFSLFYNPEPEFSTPPAALEEAEETIAREMAQTHVRGWEQILNLLRGAVGVEVYDSEDEHHESDEDMAEELAL